jgi:hypothetical protein
MADIAGVQGQSAFLIVGSLNDRAGIGENGELAAVNFYF